MRFALDYDDTITLDFVFWIDFIDRAKAAGHEVRVVTFRTYQEAESIHQDIKERCDIIATSRAPKREYCAKVGYFPQIWIDDSPEYIVDFKALGCVLH